MAKAKKTAKKKAVRKNEPPKKVAIKRELKTYAVTAAAASIHADITDESLIGAGDSQLLFGETFKSTGRTGEWLQGTALSDGRKGYIRESALRPEKEKPTHIVDRSLAHIYPRPDYKTRPVMTLGFMSRVHAELGSVKNGFVKITGAGWIFKNHLKKIAELKQNMDPLAAALKFLGAPYLLGGRSGMGIDAPGLTQLALSYCAMPWSPLDEDHMGVGRGVSVEQMQRSDLVFFKGHMGFMIDRSHMLSASSRSMDVRIERLEELAALYSGIVAIRRIKT